MWNVMLSPILSVERSGTPLVNGPWFQNDDRLARMNSIEFPLESPLEFSLECPLTFFLLH